METDGKSVLEPAGETGISSENIMKDFPKKDSSGTKSKAVLAFVTVLVVLAGILTGWVLSGSNLNKGQSEANPSSTTVAGGVKDEMGVLEKGAQYEEVEGVLEEGGIDGEGTHHLVRSGGPSQNVYLTSSTLDLQSFVGKKVHIWGITISGQKAGWLMEAGKIKTVN